MVNHECSAERPKQGYGAAITCCYSDATGRLWVSNDEYASQVAFCPFCGTTAENNEDFVAEDK